MGRQGWAATCWATQCRSYVTKRIARAGRRRIARETRQPLSDLRVQGCEHCGLWHIRWVARRRRG